MQMIDLSGVKDFNAARFLIYWLVATVIAILRNRFRETRPAAARLELVTGGKERLSRNSFISISF